MYLVTNFEQTLLKEVAALPGLRRADVLAFVGYLRISRMDDTEIELFLLFLRSLSRKPLTPKSLRLDDLQQRQTRGGSRYRNLLLSHFVQESDLTMNKKLQIKTCPTCGSDKIKRVTCDLSRTFKG